jgi:hypothetical protein
MGEGSGAGSRACSADNRQSVRAPVKIIADMLISEGPRFKVLVQDLSPTGFRIQTANAIPRDRMVYLTMPGFNSLQARVAWNDRENYGCEFVRPLHRSIAAHLAQRFPSLFN